MSRNDHTMRVSVNHLRDRLDQRLLDSDIRSIKDGFLDYLVINRIEVNENLTVSKNLLSEMMGYIMLLNNDWVALDYDHIVTSQPAIKEWYNIIDGQIRSVELLTLKVEERKVEKELLMQRRLEEDGPPMSVKEQIQSSLVEAP